MFSCFKKEGSKPTSETPKVEPQHKNITMPRTTWYVDLPQKNKSNPKSRAQLTFSIFITDRKNTPVTMTTTKPVKLGVIRSTFSGRADQDPYKYLQRFELAAQANSWDETIKTAQLQNYLADTALLWLHKYLKEQNAQATAAASGTPTIAKIKWKDITEALQKAFRTVASKEVAEDKMLARKQRSGESPEDYVHAKIDLISDFESDMDETTQVRHIVRGLKPLYFEKIYPQNLKTVEEVLNQICRISDTQFLITKYEEVNSVEPATKAVADLSKILELQNKQHAQQMDKMMEVFTTQFKFQNNKTQNFSQQNNLVQCANCGYLQPVSTKGPFITQLSVGKPAGAEFNQPNTEQSNSANPRQYSECCGIDNPRLEYGLAINSSNLTRTCGIVNNLPAQILYDSCSSATIESNLPQPTHTDKSHLEKLLSRIHPEAPSEEKEEIAKVLTEYQDVFSKPGEIGLVNCYKHKIQLIEGAKPVKKAPYRKPAHLEKLERETVQDLLNKGIIRPSHSPWASGVVIVTEGHKNSEGQKSPRLAVDYRNLNSQIQQDSFPLLNIQTVLDWIGSRANFISVMDCSKGFWSIPLEEESIPLKRYIANYSTISEPLTKLTRKNIPYIWGTKQEQAFQALKFHLTNPPLLAFYDPDRPIHIQCDASGVGIGSCLMELNEKGHEQPVAYASKTLNEYQRRYNNTEREFYAIYHALRVFHPYIYGKKFKIFTDHQTITQIKFASQTEKTSNRLTTWALLLQEHNCTLMYRKGSEQKIADGLSRLPIEDPEKLEIPTLCLESSHLLELQQLDKECQAILSSLATGSIKFKIKDVHDCHNIVYKDIAPNGQKFKMIADGLFWTGNTYPSLEYTWPKTQEVLTVNYFFINMKISINNEDDTIITMTNMLDTCKAQQGHCPTQDGILIWKSEDVDHCRLAEGETTDCLYTDNRISCHALNLAISDPKTISMCKRTIGYSKQGLMFTPINNSEVDFISLSTHKFREVVQGKVKVKRDIMKPLLFPKVKLDAQVNGELQFLYDAPRDDVSYALQIIHRDTCKSQQLELELVRALQNLDKVQLRVFKCTEIWEYMFLRQTNCTLEYPVSYMYQHQKHEGWIQGLSHEIVQSPTMTSCPAPVWLFDMGNKVIKLSNHSLPASTIPYLPSPRETAEYPTIRDLSFDQTGIYSLKQISGETTILDLMQQLQERTRISDLIKTKEEGASFNTEQIRLSRLIQDITVDPIRKYFNITITICITLLIVYILYTTKISSSPFRKRIPISQKFAYFWPYFYKSRNSN
ncbi:Retrovirus-related Pol polyprotein from transposon opus [Folsomia candida]|uniref:Retrovirus-related Pol polyprotein from transposon opus n=1 Tax=Folsomia candida TaxID=158441 RepID=A0A226DKC6_FOLCA|nr:Retrovirus-related Pol polyprotein from transposon opus [Folsomia candida]